MTKLIFESTFLFIFTFFFLNSRARKLAMEEAEVLGTVALEQLMQP